MKKKKHILVGIREYDKRSWSYNMSTSVNKAHQQITDTSYFLIVLVHASFTFTFSIAYRCLTWCEFFFVSLSLSHTHHILSLTLSLYIHQHYNMTIVSVIPVSTCCQTEWSWGRWRMVDSRGPGGSAGGRSRRVGPQVVRAVSTVRFPSSRWLLCSPGSPTPSLAGLALSHTHHR